MADNGFKEKLGHDCGNLLAHCLRVCVCGFEGRRLKQCLLYLL
jgi:hypothetical protein